MHAEVEADTLVGAFRAKWEDEPDQLESTKLPTPL